MLVSFEIVFIEASRFCCAFHVVKSCSGYTDSFSFFPGVESVKLFSVDALPVSVLVSVFNPILTALNVVNLNVFFKADKVLEINAKHKLFETLENLYNDGDENLADYVELLYNQALLIEGFPVKNPVEFSKKMCELMIKSSKY